MDGAESSELASVFADAIQLADDVAPVSTPGIDGATAGAIGMSISRRLRDLHNCLERVPSIDGVPPKVLEHLKALARIVRGTRTDCIAYGDVALYLARSDMRTIARDGWLALTRSRPRNQGLLAWAGDGASTMTAEGNSADAIADFDADKANVGFLGGASLADALGIHPTQQEAFFQKLGRERKCLGDDCWHEVREPRPNSPRFLYLADSQKLRDLAAEYKKPKPA